MFFFCFFQAEDGIRDFHVTGVQTCALPISCRPSRRSSTSRSSIAWWWAWPTAWAATSGSAILSIRARRASSGSSPRSPRRRRPSVWARCGSTRSNGPRGWTCGTCWGRTRLPRPARQAENREGATQTRALAGQEAPQEDAEEEAQEAAEANAPPAAAAGPLGPAHLTSKGTRVTRPIVFCTDYGLDDEFVGVCHGVIARIAPGARVIDLA